MKKTLYLLDAYALVYRAHYAFIKRPLVNSKGVNTSAVAGFTRYLWDIIQNKKPTHIGVAFDLSGPTFRHEIFPEYKANREAQPEDITYAVPVIKDILKAFNIPILEVAGYEADDVIGTIAKNASAKGFDVYMVTPDKDFGQLVEENIFLYKPGNRGSEPEIMGIKEITEKWGIQRVEQVIDMLALQGDAVDNIPGVRGIGPKTAAKLLQAYDSVEGVIENVDEIKGKNQERIREQQEQALLSKTLARIDTAVPLSFDPDSLHINEFNNRKLAELFRELEFRTLAERILSTTQGVQATLFGDMPTGQKVTTSTPPAHSVAENNIENTPHQYHLVQAQTEIDQLVQLLSNNTVFCFDTETTGLDPNQAELVGMSFSVELGVAYYVPIPEDELESKDLVKNFAQVFENETINKIGQNLKYDAIILRRYGVEAKGIWFDTMIAHYLLEPGLRHGMNYMAETYLKYQPVSIEKLIGKKGASQLSMRDVAIDKVKEYASEDADITMQLADYFSPLLKEEKLDSLFYDIEMPLSKVLMDMEYEGVKIDAELLHDYSKELGTRITEIESTIFEQNGFQSFNLNSPRQIGTVLFDKLKIPYRWSKTKTGQYKTGEEILSELSEEYQIVRDILTSRSLNKLKSTYVDALPKMVNPLTGRIHSSFNQALAATGRLSSNNPNLQNIPIRTPEGRKVREAFVPRDAHHVLLAADYSQVELRLIAELSEEHAMLEAFIQEKDIHRATAANVFQVEYDAVTPDQRRQAKTVNFSIIYGAGATNLSRQLNIKRKEASALIQAYFEQYPNLKKYMDETIAFAREHGYVQTLIGRKRQLRDINSRNGLSRSNAERMAINTPVQGTAADLIKIAMNQIHQAFQEKGLLSKMVLQVHDELVFDVLKSELDIVKTVVEEKMRTALPQLKVPIVVDLGVGDNWLEAH